MALQKTHFFMNRVLRYSCYRQALCDIFNVHRSWIILIETTLTLLWLALMVIAMNKLYWLFTFGVDIFKEIFFVFYFQINKYFSVSNEIFTVRKYLWNKRENCHCYGELRKRKTQKKFVHSQRIQSKQHDILQI